MSCQSPTSRCSHSASAGSRSVAALEDLLQRGHGVSLGDPHDARSPRRSSPARGHRRRGRPQVVVVADRPQHAGRSARPTWATPTMRHRSMASTTRSRTPPTVTSARPRPPRHTAPRSRPRRWPAGGAGRRVGRRPRAGRARRGWRCRPARSCPASKCGVSRLGPQRHRLAEVRAQRLVGVPRAGGDDAAVGQHDDGLAVVEPAASSKTGSIRRNRRECFPVAILPAGSNTANRRSPDALPVHLDRSTATPAMALTG